MKTVYTIILLLFFSVTAFAQGDGITVCHTSSTEKFAIFASSKDFNAAHPNPLPFVHISQEGGKMISFKTPDGSEGKGFLLMSKNKTNNWIFVFQEWWG